MPIPSTGRARLAVSAVVLLAAQVGAGADAAPLAALSGAMPIAAAHRIVRRTL